MASIQQKIKKKKQNNHDDNLTIIKSNFSFPFNKQDRGSERDGRGWEWERARASPYVLFLFPACNLCCKLRLSQSHAHISSLLWGISGACVAAAVAVIGYTERKY